MKKVKKFYFETDHEVKINPLEVSIQEVCSNILNEAGGIEGKSNDLMGTYMT